VFSFRFVRVLPIPVAQPIAPDDPPPRFPPHLMRPIAPDFEHQPQVAHGDILSGRKIPNHKTQIPNNLQPSTLNLQRIYLRTSALSADQLVEVLLARRLRLVECFAEPVPDPASTRRLKLDSQRFPGAVAPTDQHKQHHPPSPVALHYRLAAEDSVSPALAVDRLAGERFGGRKLLGRPPPE
jgi:hypothetical protein